MVKVIFCDLDDTLLMPKTKQIKIKDVQAIEHWLTQGNQFVLATARHHTFLNAVTKQLQAYDFDCIGWNGAEIYIDHKVVELYPFSHNEVLDLYQALAKYKSFAKLTNIKNEYIFGQLHSSAHQVFENDYNAVVDMNIDTYLQEEKYSPIIHINYIFDTPKQHQEFYNEYCNTTTINHAVYNCKNTSTRSFDITHKEATKEKGILRYLKIKNIPLKDAITIGDSPNDIGMLKLVKHSFCMASGNKEAKVVAFKVIDSVSDAIRYLERDEKL